MEDTENNMNSNGDDEPSLATNSLVEFITKTIISSWIIFFTTADDALWLIPFLTKQSYSKQTKIIHGLVFLLTLQLVVHICSLVVDLFGMYFFVDKYLPWIAALVCWSVALYLYVKKYLKRLKRVRENERLEKEEQSVLTNSNNQHRYDEIEENKDISEEEQENDDSAQPLLVMTLTFLGASDEFAYFPTLLINTFTVWELSMGALIACFLILIVITVFLTRMKPVLEWMDSIPLYAIVSLFAVFLSFEAIYESFT